MASSNRTSISSLLDESDDDDIHENCPATITADNYPEKMELSNNNTEFPPNDDRSVTINNSRTHQSLSTNHRPAFLKLFDQNSSKYRSSTKIFDDDEFLKRKPIVYQTKFQRLIKVLLEEWLFLALLGIISALISFGMDLAIEFLQDEHKKMMGIIHQQKMPGIFFARYFLWVAYTVILVIGSAVFVHYVAPQAIGSGIPEMKTILRGVMLKEYLSFRTLISKVVGLTLSLGSGLPIGKEGPFVHVASVVANLLSHLVASFNPAYVNESRSAEMLAAGCAVGVACTFSAPVGGVLFSIEVTSVYFAVRNYWRAFFAATCAAAVFRLLRYFTSEFVTVVAFCQTTFVRDSFLPTELPIFALIGLLCGLLSAAFIYIQRKTVLFLQKNKFTTIIFQKYWLIYPIFIAFMVSSLTFPDGFGKFIGGRIRFMNAAQNFFQNCIFTETDVNSPVFCNDDIRQHWTVDGTESPFITLSSFLVVFYFLTAIASTLPIPCGIFGPSYIIGGCIGRLTGEIVAYSWDRTDFHIYPGVYAVVGAAAFCGGVTHTVSVAVIVFELTGQLVYILPVMIAVLIANAVCSYLQPSIYDSIIQVKHLPYLPDIPHSSSNFHGIRVEQFMTSNVKYLSKKSTFAELQDLLVTMPKLKAFPIVSNGKDKILIGSCSRIRLLNALNAQVGPIARQREAYQRIQKVFSGDVKRNKSENLHVKRKYEIPNFEADEIENHENQKLEKENVETIVEDDDEVFEFDSNSGSQKLLEELKSNSNHKDRTESTASRFTVVPVSEPALEEVVETKPLENLVHHLLPSHTFPETLENAKNYPEKRRASGYSLVSVMKNLKKENRPKSFYGKACESIHTSSSHQTFGGFVRTLTRISFKSKNKKSDEDYDLFGEDRRKWEHEQLEKVLNFDEIGVDPAPFQLVEHSSLFKVHSLFSLLGLNRAYVTNCGKLVGVVALTDLRSAIEKIQNGQLYSKGPSIFKESTQRSVDSNLQNRNDANFANDRRKLQREMVQNKTPHVKSHETLRQLSIPSKASIPNEPNHVNPRPSFRVDTVSTIEPSNDSGENDEDEVFWKEP